MIQMLCVADTTWISPVVAKMDIFASQPARGHARRFVEMALAVSDHDQEDHQLELGRSETRSSSLRALPPGHLNGRHTEPGS
jgi:hypothetical protein